MATEVIRRHFMHFDRELRHLTGQTVYQCGTCSRFVRRKYMCPPPQFLFYIETQLLEWHTHASEELITIGEAVIHWFYENHRTYLMLHCT